MPHPARAGLRDLSVAPAHLALAKAAIAGVVGLGIAKKPASGPADAETAIIAATSALLSAVHRAAPLGHPPAARRRLGKHRASSTQITSPAYSTPIPPKHLPSSSPSAIFSPQERDSFSPPTASGAPGQGCRYAAGMRNDAA